MRMRGNVLRLDQHRGRNIAEDEVAVAVAHVVVAGADLGADHQHRAGMACPDIVRRRLDPEGRRGTGDVHVEPETIDPQCGLYLDRHCRIGALHVGRRAQHRVDILGIAPGSFECLLGRLDPHLGQHRKLLVGAFGPARGHDLRVEQRRLGHDIAGFDPASLLDEFDRTRLQRLHFARGNFRGIGRVEPLDIGVEAFNQFGIGDGFGRGE